MLYEVIRVFCEVLRTFSTRWQQITRQKWKQSVLKYSPKLRRIIWVGSPENWKIFCSSGFDVDHRPVGYRVHVDRCIRKDHLTKLIPCPTPVSCLVKIPKITRSALFILQRRPCCTNVLHCPIIQIFVGVAPSSWCGPGYHQSPNLAGVESKGKITLEIPQLALMKNCSETHQATLHGLTYSQPS
jgi:hypothetical protein